MADLSINFAGIRSPNPFWLASAPPTNSGTQIHRAFEAGWGGAVWKTIGAPVLNVSNRYGAWHYGNQKMLAELIKGGIRHRGFALIDVFSPCVTYNKDNTYQWFRPRVKDLADLGHDPTNFHTAMDRSFQWDGEIPIGLFWKRDDLPALDQLEPVLAEGGPMAHRSLGIDPEVAKSLIQELM